MASKLSNWLFWGSVAAAPLNLFVILTSLKLDSPELRLLALGNLAMLGVGVVINYYKE